MTIPDVLGRHQGAPITLRLTETVARDGGKRRYVCVEGRAGAIRMLGEVLLAAAETAERAGGGYHVVLAPEDLPQVALDGADALSIDVLRGPDEE